MIPVPHNQTQIINEIDKYFYSNEAKIDEPQILKEKIQKILDKYLK